MSITQKDYYYARAYDEFDINDKNINNPFLSKIIFSTNRKTAK
jgi:hypothetical protein